MPESHLIHELGRTPGGRQVPGAALIVALSTGHQLPELTAIRLGVPLHHWAEAGQLGGPAVQIQGGQRAGKATNVKTPEGDAGQGRRQPRPQGAGQLAVLGLLIPSPVDGGGVLPCIPCPAKQGLTWSQMPGIRLRILLGIAVLSRPAGAAICKAHVLPVDELPTIRFESVHPKLGEVFSLGKPGFLRVRAGEVRDHGAGKPVPFRDNIGAAVPVLDAETSGNGIRPIQLVLRIDRLIGPLLLIDRDLPQQEMDPPVVQPPDHAGGVRPGRVGKIKVLQPERAPVRLGGIAGPPKDVEGGLIAPRLGHQGTHREPVFLRLGGRPLHLLLAVPVVGGDPRAKGPFGGQLGRAEQAHIVLDYATRRSFKEHYAAIHR